MYHPATRKSFGTSKVRSAVNPNSMRPLVIPVDGMETNAGSPANSAAWVSTALTAAVPDPEIPKCRPWTDAAARTGDRVSEAALWGVDESDADAGPGTKP